MRWAVRLRRLKNVIVMTESCPDSPSPARRATRARRTSMSDCVHEPLAPSPTGFSCSACGYVWDAPYFLAYQLRLIRQGNEEMERKAEEKRAKKDARKPVDIEPVGVVISPSVAAYFTDDPSFVGELGKVYKCEKCHKAPRRHPDFANKWKWKTAKGFNEHRCLG